MKNFIQSIKDFFSNLFKRFRKAPVESKPVEATPVATTPVLIEPTPVPADSKPVPTVFPPTTLPDTAHDASVFGYAPKPGDPVRPTPVSTTPEDTTPPSKRDPTKAWFGTEFQGPGTLSSIVFEAHGTYEVVTGYDVDRGNITASIPGVGVIHGSQMITLDGQYTIVLTATGSGGSSIQLYKRG